MGWATTDDPRSQYATLRLTVGEEQEIVQAAAIVNKDKSAFVRAATLKEARRVLKKTKGGKTP